MAEDSKTTKATKSTAAKSTSEPTVEDDKRQLAEQLTPDAGRRVDIDKNPPEAEQNGADWLEGREPNDVVEVEGQRETVESRMARNGVTSPEAQVGATTKPGP